MQLKSRIPLIIAELSPKMLEGVVEFAEEIVTDAKDRVPIGATGNLQKSIHVEVDEERDEVLILAGDDVAWYGHIVENGSVHAAPHPFLIPAYETKRPSLEKVIGEKLRDL